MHRELISATIVFFAGLQALHSIYRHLKSFAGGDRLPQDFGTTGNKLNAVLILSATFGLINKAILIDSQNCKPVTQVKFFFKKVSLFHPVICPVCYALLYAVSSSCVVVLYVRFDLLTEVIVLGSFVFYILIAETILKNKRKGIIKEKIQAYPLVLYFF
jgi:basic amino acid/polyamine antiporter, APA family